MSTHGECEYDADAPCLTCYPYRHAADDTPTSEECPGLDNCPDCQDVLRQVADSIGPGEFTTAGTRYSHHDLIVADDGTFTAYQEPA
ncbi:MAG: hypothetical protein ACXVYY_01135 [Oryzihumus sp.]